MENETSKERLVSDLRTLVGDAEELLKATTNQAGEKVTAARQWIEQSLIEGKKGTGRRRKSPDVAEDYVARIPGAPGYGSRYGSPRGLCSRVVP